ncbi:MAG TPA: hypothetical protein VKO86_13675 [Gemmatimonadales bacterium]|nr:hypothetical protein [Gemmatimonadales bacterium]
MRRSMLVVCALLAGTTLGCDKIKQAIDKRRNSGRTPATQTATRDTTKKPAPAAGTPAKPAPGTPTTPATRTPAAPTQTATERPAPPSTPAPRPPQPVLRDEPYNSADTGTIAPGMTQQDVTALWGRASAVRHAGEYTYLHYPNGCERSCGTDDVVILQNDKVVDVILRWHGHGYSGQSSSPPGKTPVPNVP